jgi:hypothetical protein
MDLTSINLVQQISANVTSTSGLEGSVRVGGTNTTALTTTNADSIFAFSLTSGDTANTVIWNIDTSSLEIASTSSAGDNLISSNPVGASGSPSKIIDAAGAQVANSATVVAIYYETPKANVGDVTITTGGSNANKLGGTFVLDGDAGTSSRSALLIPRFSISSGNKVTFTWTNSGDTIKVVCLAKD